MDSTLTFSRPDWDDETWALLEGAMKRLEAAWTAWHGGPEPELMGFVPIPSGDLRRGWMIVRLIEADYQCRFAANRLKRIKQYLAECPEVAAQAELRSYLVRALDRTICIPGRRCGFEPYPLPKGHRVGRFEIQDVLGQGAMGTVYRARDVSLGTYRALKVPRRELSREYVQRLIAEARKLAALNHPGIVAVQLLERTSDGTTYLVMECLPHSLEQKLRNGPLRPGRAVELMIEIADAVHHAHTQRILHRDLKPSNILLDEAGKPRVADFGLAVYETDQLLRLPEVVGTLQWMAPEQLRGEVLDSRTDVWGLGAILYLMLTGYPPFEHNDPAELKQAILSRPPQPRLFEAGIPQELTAICMKCLSKRPLDRFGSASQLAAELAKQWGQLYQTPGPAADSYWQEPPYAPCYWQHKTADDERYVPPTRALESLNEWAADARTRVIALTGFGGVGKTALVVHWLKNAAGAWLHQHYGLFYWSFNFDISVDHFLRTLVQFVGDSLGWQSSVEAASPLEESLELLRTVPLVLVLDGLEAHQEGQHEIGRLIGVPDPQSPDLHEFVCDLDSLENHELRDPRLRTLLDAACKRTSQPTIIVVTSRFPVAELTSHLGNGFQLLQHDQIKLTDEQGARLLDLCGLATLTEDRRRELSDDWDGHPLGLRLLASLTKRSGNDPIDPPSLATAPECPDPNEARLGCLAQFYHQHLSRAQKALLGIISIFRVPATFKLIATLAREVPLYSRVLGGLASERLYLEIQNLVAEGLILRKHADETEDGYSCHLILREHFRRPARDFVDGPVGLRGFQRLATTQTGGKDRIALTVGIIELLIDADDMKRADEVFRSELDDGRILLEEGELEAGKLCVLEFVRDEERRRHCEMQLSETRLVFYLRMAGLYLLLVGNTKDAQQFHALAEKLTTTQETLQVLLNHSLIWSLTGRPREGEHVARRAVTLARTRGDARGTQNALCCLAHSLSVQGRTSEADASFAEANAVGIEGDLGHKGLAGPDLILRTSHLLRIGRIRQAKQAVECELPPFTLEGTPGADPEHLARCRWALACVELVENNTAKAWKHVSEAEKVFRSHRSLLMLPLALETKARALWKMHRLEEADECCESARYLAAERRLVWMHIALTTLSARIRLDQTLAETNQTAIEKAYGISIASGLADHAVRLAEQYRYPWLERDALLVLAEAEEAEGELLESEGHRRCADSLADQLLRGVGTMDTTILRTPGEPETT